MDKQYTSKVLKRKPRPRSARLRDTGAGGGSTASMTVIYGGGSASGAVTSTSVTSIEVVAAVPASPVSGTLYIVCSSLSS